MATNPMLKKLGLADDDRALIIHMDDVGMCQATLDAYTDLLDCGGISSAGVMPPCAWFPAAAAICRERGAAVDMGIHVTLNCEMEGYRWAPLSTCDPASGLIDAAGYFHADPEVTKAQADSDAVYREIEAQVTHALNAGIDVTHLDSHMFAIGQRPDFFQSYVRVALQYQVPPLLLHVPPQFVTNNRAELGQDLERIIQYMQALEAQGIPVLDTMISTPLDAHENRLEVIKDLVAALTPGITYFFIHPAKDTPELRALAPDWRARVADYEAFTGEAVRALLRDAGVHVIGWRPLRDAMRAAH